MSGIFLSLRQLSVNYDRNGLAALAGVDLDIVAGERLAIIGESGSGKSTLARALAGLLPDGATVDGEMLWPGLGHLPRPGRDFGFVFQDPGSSLNPVLTIGEQVAEGARRHLGLSWKQAYIRAEELLERVRIPQPDKVMQAFPHQLSGGQRQRVAIAAAIAAKPQLLIADEATSALDVVVQAEIVRLLDGLVREDGMTLLFITHDIALASGFVDRIAVFRNARLVEAGPVRSVLSAPKSDYTAALIASHRDLATPPLIAEALP
ncbi:peptide/nickel transport system ATP-binding protein [Rhizobium leguminosarum]|uniref:Nickel import system ATP-binding protein NikD n=1 Tax=Rhizobium leguminosarum TaxID=384 RepID=A0AAE2MR65_RHILE|nr:MULTISPECIES: ABC transporter ATP-binding protein [Rhizobium]MBB4293645.1 peptide/nickel transport system ATP-binding protein [Rhizobium leguminosarum]MBB4300302.1 peptide/nickel transport system ATP-binding protein [Rhizobium leguminosarum]MBB4311573.1 peptide/nickel transport system ATP-binding protein [Rhizobium leguminosarum]MBB4420388.1 peptide/nickel transport system ATP-binding protein [Rhizobium leguminosarum]MBB4435727.1 peptide/nickel transport system ATP-binding protein [Rhizobiu